MELFTSALLPLDLKEKTQDIMLNAKNFREFGTKKIILMHIITAGEKAKNKAEKDLKKTGSFIEKIGFEVETLIQEGHPATVISEKAEENHVGVIYIPWSRKHKIRRALLGSTARDIMRLSSTPVFLHKDIFGFDEPFNGTVIFATDFSQESLKAFPYLKSINNSNFNIEILHTSKRAADPATEQIRKNNVFERLESLKSELALNYQQIFMKDETGQAAKIIIRHVKKLKAQLLVVGRFKENVLSEMSGSTVEKIANRAPCSILMIPS